MRHLVEVPASEKNYIEAWLDKTIGVQFIVPDPTDSGFGFQSASLLVVAEKLVVPLLFTNAAGTVVAICALTNSTGASQYFSSRDFGDIHMVRRSMPTASYVVVGTQSVDLTPIAQSADTDIWALSKRNAGQIQRHFPQPCRDISILPQF